jgi:hypothetical protein
MMIDEPPLALLHRDLHLPDIQDFDDVWFDRCQQFIPGNINNFDVGAPVARIFALEDVEGRDLTPVLRDRAADLLNPT